MAEIGAPGMPDSRDPELGPMHRRLLLLERRMSAVETATPLMRGAMSDRSGQVRLRTGFLDGLDDPSGDGPVGVQIFGLAGGSLLRADEDGLSAVIDSAAGGLTIDGGTVRAVSASVDYDTFSNSSITTLASHVSHVLTRPAWATIAIVDVVFNYQLSNLSGAGVLQGSRVYINGVGSATLQQSVANNDTQLLPNTYAQNLTGLATDVTVEGHVSVSSGTNTSNFGALKTTVLWMR